MGSEISASDVKLMDAQVLFFELIKIAVGNLDVLSRQPSKDEWEALYRICEKQTLLGIGFVAISKLPSSYRPPRPLLLKWISASEKIRQRNALVSHVSHVVTEKLNKDGMWSCILKGQSNLANYSQYDRVNDIELTEDNDAKVNLADYRTAGDIDIWCHPRTGEVSKWVRKTIDYSVSLAKTKGVNLKSSNIRYNHIELSKIWQVSVEIHYRPSFVFNLIKNVKFQRWLLEHILYCDNSVCVQGYWLKVPNNSFNAIYQLSHLYCHLFDGGIGLRQLLDYYFVLRSLNISQEDGDQNVLSKKEIMATLEQFGLTKFASAVMYVLKVTFSIPSDWLLCEPNAKEGGFILNEIMISGNMGKYDKRISHSHGQLSHAFVKVKHNLRLFYHYPADVVWEPIFRIMHFMWRTCQLWRL